MELRDYAENLLALKNRKDEIKDELKDINAEIGEIEKEVAMRMLNEGHDKISFPGIATMSPSVAHYPRIVDEHKFFNYLRENGQESLIKETVNSRTLSAWFKDEVFEIPVVEIGLEDFTKTKINFRRRA